MATNYVLSLATLWQTQVAARETTWPAKPTVFYHLALRREKFANPCQRMFTAD